VSLEGLSYVVTIKEDVRDKDLRIIGCEDSEIFINSQVRSLYIVNCVNCTIYIAACQRIAFVDKCERVAFTVGAHLLRVCNTHDSNIYYYGSSPLILTGDNKGVAIGPNNSPAPDLPRHLQDAHIEHTEAYTLNFEQVLFKSMITNEHSWTKMPPSEFDLLVLPEKEDDDERDKRKPGMGALLAPKDYLLELEKRNNYYSSFKGKISKGGLTPDMANNLHAALQGNFREWLTAKGYTKNLNDLVKMLDRK
jgi:hypothetical protein